jgi:transposase
MCGVSPNIVTSTGTRDAFSSDFNNFEAPVDATDKNFVMNEASADKGYSSSRNLHIVQAKSAIPYIAFRSNANPTDKRNSALWKRMFHFYNYNREAFMRHYHKRSNVETVFSMIKAKFGERLRSRTTTAQGNEVLCKVLCHNLCCLIQSMYELGVEPNFGAD